MTAFVADASLALAWCFEGESTPATSAALDRAARFGIIVPRIWFFEAANVILLAERKGRISADRASLSRTLLRELDVSTDSDSERGAFGAVTSLARTHGLTVYDSAYLELAKRLSLQLGTLDQELRMAATKEGVELLGI